MDRPGGGCFRPGRTHAVESLGNGPEGKTHCRMHAYSIRNNLARPSHWLDVENLMPPSLSSVWIVSLFLFRSLHCLVYISHDYHFLPPFWPQRCRAQIFACLFMTHLEFFRNKGGGMFPSAKVRLCGSWAAKLATRASDVNFTVLLEPNSLFDMLDAKVCATK